jgi:predicted nuclease of predicted toxin-antitoxin system
VRLLLDEHLPPRIAVELRVLGHDVVAVVERPDLHGAADDTLWEAARTEHRMVVTQDVGDFMRLALQDTAIAKAHPGLVLLHRRWFSRGDRDVGRLVVSLRALLAANPTDRPLAGQIIWLEAVADES